MDKKGVSAVVATVLTILITVAGVAIIWGAIIPIFRESVTFSGLESSIYVDTTSGYTAYDAEKELVVVQIARGSDDSKIDNIQVIFSIEGQSYSTTVPAPAENQKKAYTFNFSGLVLPDSVSIAPVYSVGTQRKVGSISSEVSIVSGSIVNVAPEDEWYNLGGDYSVQIVDPCADVVCDSPGSCETGTGTCVSGVCVYDAVGCVDADGCCTSGCTFLNDDDCPEYCIDGDADTYGLGCSAGSDCDDTDSSVWKSWSGIFVDVDSDNYGEGSVLTVCAGASSPSGYVSVGGDCDGSSASVNPSVTETCNNVDDDCDGSIDEGLTQICGSSIGACEPGLKTCSAGVWGSCIGNVAPVTEICGDGIDNDCDSSVDEDCTVQDFCCGASFDYFSGSVHQGECYFDNGGDIEIFLDFSNMVVDADWAAEVGSTISSSSALADKNYYTLKKLEERLGGDPLVLEHLTYGYWRYMSPVLWDNVAVMFTLELSCDAGVCSWSGNLERGTPMGDYVSSGYAVLNGEEGTVDLCNRGLTIVSNEFSHLDGYVIFRVQAS